MLSNELKPAPGTYFRRIIELFEAEAWVDMYNAADKKIKNKLGLNVIPFGNSSATIIPEIDILALNRLCGAGINEIIDKEMLTILKNELGLSRVKRFFYQLAPDTIQKDTEELLENSGFYYYNNWIKLYRKNYPAARAITSASIREIDNRNSNTFADILLESFEWPDKLAAWFASTVGRLNWKHYIAYSGKKAVGTAMMYINGDFAWLGFAGTLAEYRNNGIQSALLERRIEDARHLGVQIMIIETAEDKSYKPSISNRNVIRAGFESAYIRPNYIIKLS